MQDLSFLSFVHYDCRGNEQTTIAASHFKFHQRFHAQWNTYIIYLCTMVKFIILGLLMYKMQYLSFLSVAYYDCRGKEQTTEAASNPKFHRRFHAQWNTYLYYLPMYNGQIQNFGVGDLSFLILCDITLSLEAKSRQQKQHPIPSFTKDFMHSGIKGFPNIFTQWLNLYQQGYLQDVGITFFECIG